MRKLVLLTCLAVLASCAKTPPITAIHYPAKSGLHVRVVRTIACDKLNHPVVASSVTATSSHAADFGSPLGIEFKGIDGPLANSDIKLEYYADGRLKSANATTTGQGETILKSAISLVASVSRSDGAPKNYTPLCKDFRKRFGETPLSLGFEIQEDFSLAAQRKIIGPDVQSRNYYRLYGDLIGQACLDRGAVVPPNKPVLLAPNIKSHATLHARQPAYVPISVSAGALGNCDGGSIWSGIVAVGQLGTTYEIPIPKSAPFGKQVFAATFDEAGGVTMLQYGKETGEGGAVAVLQGLRDAVRGESDADKVARLKTEADVIAAQQRLVKCQASPDSCD